MIENARATKVASDYATQAAGDSTFGTTDTAITTAKNAGQTQITLTSGNYTPALLAYLRDRGYEVRQLANGTSYQIDWSTPTDASFI